MIEIFKDLFIGTQLDYEDGLRGVSGWAIVHACKEPYHRQALGYAGRGATKDHPEYLIARRGQRLILNLVDADDPAYIPSQVIDAAIDFIDKHLRIGDKVLVHCNQGASRSPAIGLLYLASQPGLLPITSFLDAERAFRLIYPPYDPARGVRMYMAQNWDRYACRSE